MTFETISQVIVKRFSFQDVVAERIFGADAYEEDLIKKAAADREDDED